MNIVRRRQIKPTIPQKLIISQSLSHGRNVINLTNNAQLQTSRLQTDCGWRRLRRYRKSFYIFLGLLIIPIISYWHILIHYILPATSSTYISPILGFHPEWHPQKRADRFPGVEKRVKLYMSNFYLPPSCNETDNARRMPQSADKRLNFSYDFNSSESSPGNKYPEVNLFRSDEVQSIARLNTKIKFDIPIVLWEDALEPCYIPSFERSYCSDSRKIVTMAKHIMGERKLVNLPPIIAQFGDHHYADLQDKNVPFIKKFREAASVEALEKVTSTKIGQTCVGVGERQKLVPLNLQEEDHLSFSPIIWLLNYRRHYGYVLSVKWFDTPWELKKNSAIWRGLLTGLLSPEERKGKSFKERCDMLPRCRFVRKYIDTPGLDIGVSEQLDYQLIDSDNLNMIKGRKLRISFMRYKAIIIMEGNDISSGLKWSLYSRSVVLMPPPTKTSFLMEELLDPWVHYIPLEPDLSDVKEKMKWVIENDQAARKIAERATLFIHDLLYHEDSESENKQIQEEIIRRYMKFFISG